MTFNWKDYLVFAENINAAPDTPGPNEAALRSVASRAYYAAFRAAVEFGKISGFSPSRLGEDHELIRKHFRELRPASKAAMNISTQLDRLHDYRKKADYDNTLGQKPENIAYYAIGMAKKVFQCIDELSRTKAP